MADIGSWRGPEDDQVLQEASRLLAAGALVACPTETFYALAVDAGNEQALHRLLAVKGRPRSKPLLVLVADRSMLTTIVASIPPLAHQLMNHFWPGPLTLILPARPELPFPLTAGSGTVGVRQPGLTLTRRLVQIFGKPITGTSANLSGQEPFREGQQLNRALGADIDLIIQDGPCPGGLPSTIVDVCHEPLRLIRPGAISATALAQALGRPLAANEGDEPVRLA